MAFPVRAAEAAGVVLGQMRGERGLATMSVDVMVMAFAATHGGVLAAVPIPCCRHGPTWRVAASDLPS